MPSNMTLVGFNDADDRRGGDADSKGDSDEPPEIPGSPMVAQVTRAPSNQPSSIPAGRMNRLDEADIGHSGDTSRQRITKGSGASKSNGGANILRVHTSDSDDSSSGGDDDDEYVVKDTEQPRSTEFHASSSSESDDEGSDDSEDDDGNQDLARRRSSRSSQQMPMNSRPKTAAKDLECYRDVIPDEFFQQISATGDSHEMPPKKDKEKKTKSSRQQHTKTSSSGSSSTNNGLKVTTGVGSTPVAEASRNQNQKYAVPVPQEVEKLFQVRKK